MKNLLRYGFIILSSIFLFGCSFLPNEKFLEFWNGNFPSKVIVFDEKNKKNEFNIEPEWTHGWYKDTVGDFRFIYIKTENNVEGIFIINNKHKRKIIPYDIMTMTQRAKTEGYEIEHNVTILSYGITIEIIEDRFHMEYNPAKYDIFAYFNYDEGYHNFKQKYMEEYFFE